MMSYKNFIKILIFDFYMLFIVLFRLFCKTMSKEGCGIEKSLIAYIEKWNIFFMQPG